MLNTKICTCFYIWTIFFKSVQSCQLFFGTCLILQDAFKEKKTDSETDLDDTTSRSMRDMETSDVTSDEDDENDEDDEDNEIPK